MVENQPLRVSASLDDNLRARLLAISFNELVYSQIKNPYFFKEIISY
jgi:hypothetical protein